MVDVGKRAWPKSRVTWGCTSHQCAGTDMAAAGRDRRIDDIWAESDVPPIARIVARRLRRNGPRAAITSLSNRRAN